jgi:cyanate permease
MLVALVLGTVLGGGEIPTLLVIQAAFAVIAALALCAALRQRGLGKVEDDDIGVAALRAVWAEPGVRVLSGLLFLGFGAFIALTTWLQALLHHYRISANTAGSLLVAMVLAGAVGSAVLPPWLVRRQAERALVAASVLTVVVGSIVLAFVHAIAVDAIVLVPMGLLLLTDLPVVLELSERNAGAAAGTVTALLWLAGQLGGVVVSLAVQALVHHPMPAFLLLAVVGLCALPLLRRLGTLLQAARPELGTPAAEVALETS